MSSVVSSLQSQEICVEDYQTIDLLDWKKIPTKLQHSERNKYNEIPKNNIIFTTKRNSKGYRVFIETLEDGIEKEWIEQPWYLSIFHNPAVKIKLLSTDQYGGSSEITVKKSNINVVDDQTKSSFISVQHIIKGSYNYRDYNLTSQTKHFLADVLPNAIYCKCA